MGQLEAATAPQMTYDPDDDADAASLNINSVRRANCRGIVLLLTLPRLS